MRELLEEILAELNKLNEGISILPKAKKVREEVIVARRKTREEVRRLWVKLLPVMSRTEAVAQIQRELEISRSTVFRYLKK